MRAALSSAIESAVAQLLRPLVRMLLRYGVPFGAFVEIAKHVYVELAMSEFAIPGRKPTISRAAMLTGLTRKEVQRVHRLPGPSNEPAKERYNRAVRVISGWARDREFLDDRGRSIVLPIDGEERSFAALVKRYSGDVPPRAVLDELRRVGAVEMVGSGAVRLLSPVYVPAEAEGDKLAVLGADVGELIATIDHNLQVPPEGTRLQLKVAYDNLPREPLPAFRRLSAQMSYDLLKHFDSHLAALDRDTGPAAAGTGRMRAGVGIYYFEEELDDESEGT